MFSLISRSLDILLGQRCVACKKSGELLCAPCALHLPSAPRQISDIAACLDYRDSRVRKLIAALKFRGAKRAALPLGVLLYDRLMEELGEMALFNGDAREKRLLLTPIPLSPQKLRRRGYNQAEELAAALFTCTDGRSFELAPHALRKIKETESQVSLGKKSARLTNLTDSFSADPSTVRDRHVIILDDVTTTGATLKEGKRAVLAAGAASVILLALAH